MLGLLLQLGYVPIVTFAIPKSPEQDLRLLLTKPWSAVGFWLNARVRAGPRLFTEKTVCCNNKKSNWTIPGMKPGSWNETRQQLE